MSIGELSVIIGVALLIRVGQTLLLVGTVRSKNAASVAVRCVLDLAVMTLAFWAVGGVLFPINLSGDRQWFAIGNIFGGDGGLLLASVLPSLMVFTGPLIGATAERTRLTPLLAFAALSAAIVLPLTWHLSVGQPVVIVGGGAAAIAMAFVVGPRKGKFNRDLSVNFVPGHNVGYQFVGLLLMAAGFAVTTGNAVHLVLGFAAATLAGAAFGRLKFRTLDAGLMIAAAVSGLCAATLTATLPGQVVHLLGNGGLAPVIAGAAAGILTPFAVIRLETRFRIDDVAGLGVAYVIGGTVGTLISVLTQRAGTVSNYLSNGAYALMAWAVSIVVFGGLAFAIAKLLARRNALRVTETVEYDGVDLSEMDVNAYPDFQQTMIKSHHLRQL